MAAPTPLTDAEWNALRPISPNLVRDDTLKTGPATGDYNCIRFALGTPGLWVNPPMEQTDFITLCESLYIYQDIMVMGVVHYNQSPRCWMGDLSLRRGNS